MEKKRKYFCLSVLQMKGSVNLILLFRTVIIIRDLFCTEKTTILPEMKISEKYASGSQLERTLLETWLFLTNDILKGSLAFIQHFKFMNWRLGDLENSFLDVTNRLKDSYSENWWKYVVSSILDASFCVECFCHITESKANQFLGYHKSSFWSYPWGYGSNDQYIITGKFLTLRILSLYLFRYVNSTICILISNLRLPTYVQWIPW